MRKLLKWVVRITGGLLVVALAVFAFGWFKYGSGLERSYVVNDPPLAMRGDAQALKRGGGICLPRAAAPAATALKAPASWCSMAARY